MDSQLNKILAKYVETTSKSPIMILDNQGEVVFSNKHFDQQFVNEDINEIIGKINNITIEKSEDEMYKLNSYKCNFLSCTGENVHMFCKSISNHKFHLISFENLKIKDDEVIEKLSQLNIDISTMTRELSKKNIQLKKANDQIEQLLNTDVLTNVKNRRAFYTHIDELIEKSTNNTTTFGLIMVDIDFFKSINDQYGHDVGDRVLEKFAQILNDGTAQNCDVFRIGGEEFAIVVNNDNESFIYDTAEKLREKVANTVFVNIKESVTASFGVAMYQMNQSKNDLMKMADDMLYQAKHAGRNCVGYNIKAL